MTMPIKYNRNLNVEEKNVGSCALHGKMLDIG